MRINKSMRYLMPILTAVLVLMTSMPLWADVLKLRRVTTDEQGNFVVLFSVLDDNRDPMSDVAEMSASVIQVQAGDQLAELQELEIGSAEIDTFESYQVPVRIVILLPDTDLFNGVEGDSTWPDASLLRSSVAQSLLTLPQRSDIHIDIGMYNADVSWLPEVDSTQIHELSTTLLSSDYAEPPGTTDARSEDPFGAIDHTYRTRLRRQARDPGDDSFVTFFVVVTSCASRVGGTAHFDEQVEELRNTLDDRSVADVVPMVVIYDPFATDEWLNDPGGEYLRFAQGVTLDRGIYRMASTSVGVESALSQTFDEIVSSFFLSFNNTQLDGDRHHTFRLNLTLEGGAELISNAIVAHVSAREVAQDTPTDAPDTEAVDPTYPEGVDPTHPEGVDPTYPEGVDPTNPLHVANAIVEAFRSSDWNTVATFCEDPEELLHVIGENPNAFNELLADEEEWQYVMTANLPITDVRIARSDSRVWAFLGEMSEREIAVFTLERQPDGRWIWDDVHSPERSSWEAAAPYTGP